ncbi:phage virion morphogenesis protein [Albimonas pacifica]|uniref:Phage virion morphogenesis (Putative tail completion) protein n=1 Tax=Albimonas pacifica TaxID=1114924 RepID=A0A1I3Q8B5_9RHOB|nr:phage virion morphogenesis protein [Albimonas pacifica]SFJ29356.1 phage virion morphogenesis (putative tail completion) protein [Albimonas pacifica]
MLRVELKSDEAFAALDRLAGALDDMSPVMADVGEFLLESTEERFDRGVDPEGAAWAPKSQTTIDAYVRRGKAVDRRPLWGPGEGVRLAKSFSYASGPSFVELGTNAIQSAVMHFGAKKGAFGKTKRGSSIPWGDIPARPFLGLSESDQANIVELVEEWLEEIGARGR